MEYLLLILSLICIFGGFIGSVLPNLPGPPLAWLGLLLLYLTPNLPFNYWILGFSFAIVILMIILDYIIPAKGTKYFGGSKYGIWGAYIGLFIGFFIFSYGIILSSFMGALSAELIYNPKEPKKALISAIGAFLGFLTSAFVKIIICTAFLIIFFIVVWSHKAIWFS